VFLSTGGEIRPSTASSAAKDGGKETFVVVDEGHLYTTPELRRMYDTVRRNGRKRLQAEPWLLQTSTMYGIGEDSVAERTHKAAESTRVKGLLFDHVEAPEHLDPEKAEDRLAGLKVCYGPAAAWMPLDALVSDYRDPRIDPADWLRYFWNRPMAGVSDFVDGAVWDSMAMPDDPLRRGEAITLGFDGSRSDDTTALIACRMSDCRLFTVKVWQRPDDAEDGWRVPRDDVDSLLTTVFDTYAVAIMFADPSKWEPYLDAWSARWPKRVAEEWPGDKRTDRNVRLFRTLLRDGALSHDGSDVLTRHVKNAALVKGKHKPAQEITSDSDDPLARNYLRIKKKGAGKIDAAWAAMLAVAARGWAVEHGIDPKRRSSTFLSL
jgi:phage terminase large subunit-like protein